MEGTKDTLIEDILKGQLTPILEPARQNSFETFGLVKEVDYDNSNNL